jgi:hypothetical protein
MLASGLAELVSLGAVLTFLAVFSNPQQLWQQPLIQALAVRVVYSQPQQLMLPATAAFALAAGLLSGLLLIDWLAAFSTAGLFGIAYGLVAVIS